MNLPSFQPTPFSTGRGGGAIVVGDEDGFNRRIADVLREPRETLDVEIKDWLDIVNDNAHKATLAKAIIALANHGGGLVLIGLTETADGVVAAENRPNNLTGYSVDHVNAVVNRYIEPPFHCDVKLSKQPADGLEYPIVVVPGGHQFPIRAARSGPNNEGIQRNVYYIRRPGPRSEGPQSGQEWDQLIRRCITNARDDLLDRFRVLMAGGAPAVAAPEAATDRVWRWYEASEARWQDIANAFPEGAPARLPHGHYAVGYELIHDDLKAIAGPALLDRLQAGVVRYTGWPPFWVPHVHDMAPYPYHDKIECTMAHGGQSDPGHADFWRATPEGQFFLLRGYQEDARGEGQEQGTTFELTTPVWRMGEILLHAASMAEQFGVPDAKVVFCVRWSGLEGRALVSHANHHWYDLENYSTRQDVFQTQITVQADQITDALPEIVDQLLRPLYALFNFFDLPPIFVANELARMRDRR